MAPSGGNSGTHGHSGATESGSGHGATWRVTPTQATCAGCEQRYEQLDGETEILPHLLVTPTPGHTAGHQSLIVRRPDGVVVVAGQSHDTATAYGSDALARQALHDRHGPPLPPVPAWMERLRRLDPARVVFAHDNAVWEPA
jgi:N-acyl homoserine lactone hydrolase